MSRLNLKKKIGLWALIGSSASSALQAVPETKTNSYSLNNDTLTFADSGSGSYIVKSIILNESGTNSNNIDYDYGLEFSTSQLPITLTFNNNPSNGHIYIRDLWRYDPENSNNYNKVDLEGPGGVAIALPSNRGGEYTINFNGSASKIWLRSDQRKVSPTSWGGYFREFARQRSLVIGLDRGRSTSSNSNRPTFVLNFNDRPLDLFSRAHYYNNNASSADNRYRYGVTSAVIGINRAFEGSEFPGMDDYVDKSCRATIPDFTIKSIGNNSRLESIAISSLLTQTSDAARHINASASVFGVGYLEFTPYTALHPDRRAISHSIDGIGKGSRFNSFAKINKVDNDVSCAASTIFGPANTTLIKIDTRDTAAAYPYGVRLLNIGDDAAFTAIAEYDHGSSSAGIADKYGKVAAAVIGPAQVQYADASTAEFFGPFFADWNANFTGNASLIALVRSKKSEQNSNNGKGIKINTVGGDSNYKFNIAFNGINSDTSPVVNILGAVFGQMRGGDNATIPLSSTQTDTAGRPVRAIGLGRDFQLRVGSTSATIDKPDTKPGTLNLIGAVGKADNSDGVSGSRMAIMAGWTVNAWRPIADLKTIELKQGSLCLRSPNPTNKTKLDNIIQSSISPKISYRGDYLESPTPSITEHFYDYGKVLLTSDGYPIDGSLNVTTGRDQIIFHVDSSQNDTDSNFKKAKGYIEVTSSVSPQINIIYGDYNAKKIFRIINDVLTPVPSSALFHLIRLDSNQSDISKIIASDMKLSNTSSSFINGANFYEITNAEQFFSCDSTSPWNDVKLYWMSGNGKSGLVLRNYLGEVIRTQSLALSTTSNANTTVTIQNGKNGTPLLDGSYNSVSSGYFSGTGYVQSLLTSETCGVYCYGSDADQIIKIQGAGKNMQSQLVLTADSSSNDRFGCQSTIGVFISALNTSPVTLSNLNVQLSLRASSNRPAVGVSGGPLTIEGSKVVIQSAITQSKSLKAIDYNKTTALSVENSSITLADTTGQCTITGLNIGSQSATPSVKDSIIFLDQAGASGSTPGYTSGAVDSASGLRSINTNYHVSTGSLSTSTKAMSLRSKDVTFDGGTIFADSSRSLNTAAVELSNVPIFNINQGNNFGTASNKDFYALSIDFAKNFNLTGTNTTTTIGSSSGTIGIAAINLIENKAIGLDLSGVTTASNNKKSFTISGKQNYFVGLYGIRDTSAKTFSANGTQNGDIAAIQLPGNSTLRIAPAGEALSAAYFVGGIKSKVTTAKPTVSVEGTSIFYGNSAGIGAWELHGPATLGASNNSIPFRIRKADKDTDEQWQINSLPAGKLTVASGEKIIFHIDPSKEDTKVSDFRLAKGYLELEGGSVQLDLAGRIGLKNDSATAISDDQIFYLVRKNGENATMADAITSSMQLGSGAVGTGGYTFYPITNADNFVTADGGLVSWDNLELCWMSGNSRSGLVARALPAEIIRKTGLGLGTPSSVGTTVTFGDERNGTPLKDGSYNSRASLFSGTGYLKRIDTTETCGIYCYGTSSDATIHLQGTAGDKATHVKVTPSGRSSNPFEITAGMAVGIYFHYDHKSPVTISNINMEVIPMADGETTCGIINLGSGKVTINGSSILAGGSLPSSSFVYGLSVARSPEAEVVNSTLTINDSTGKGKLYGIYSNMSLLNNPFTIRDSTVTLLQPMGNSNYEGYPYGAIRLSGQRPFHSYNSRYYLQTRTNSFKANLLYLEWECSFAGGGCYAESAAAYNLFSPAVQLSNTPSLIINRGSDFGTGDKNFYSTSINFPQNIRIIGSSNPTVQIGSNSGNVSVAAFAAAGTSAFAPDGQSAIGLDLSGISSASSANQFEIGGKINYFVGLDGTINTANKTVAAAASQAAGNAAIKLPTNGALKFATGTTSHLIGGIRAAANSKAIVNCDGTLYCYGPSDGIGTWNLAAPIFLKTKSSTDFKLPSRHPDGDTQFSLSNLPAGKLTVASGEKIIFHIDPSKEDTKVSDFRLAKGYLELEGGSVQLDLAGRIGLKNDSATAISDDQIFYLVRTNGNSATIANGIKASMQLGGGVSGTGGYTFYPITNASTFQATGSELVPWDNLELCWMSGNSRSGLVARALPAEIIRKTGLGLGATSSAGTTVTFGDERNGTPLKDGTYNSPSNLFSGTGYLKRIDTTETCGIYCYGASSDAPIRIQGMTDDQSTHVKVTSAGQSADPFDIGSNTAAGIYTSSNNQSPIAISNLNVEVHSTTGGRSATGIANNSTGKLSIENSTISVHGNVPSQTWLSGIYDQSFKDVALINSSLIINDTGNGVLCGFTVPNSSATLRIKNSTIKLQQSAAAGKTDGYAGRLIGGDYISVNSCNGRYYLITNSSSCESRFFDIGVGNDGYTFDGGGTYAESTKTYTSRAAICAPYPGFLKINRGSDFGSGDKNFYSTSINFPQNFAIGSSNPTVQIGSNSGNVSIAALATAGKSAIGLDLSGISSATSANPFEIGGKINYFVGLDGTINTDNKTVTAAANQADGNAAIKLPTNGALHFATGTNSHIIGGIRAAANSKAIVNPDGTLYCYGPSDGIGTWNLAAPIFLKTKSSTDFKLPSRHPAGDTEFSLSNLPAGKLTVASGEKIIFHIDPSKEDTEVSNFRLAKGYLELEGGSVQLDLAGRIGLKNDSATAISDDQIFYLVRKNGENATMADAITSSMQLGSGAVGTGGYTFYPITNADNFVTADGGLVSWDNLELCWMSGNSRSGLVARALPAEILRTTELRISPVQAAATVNFGTTRRGIAMRNGVHLLGGEEGYLKCLNTGEACGLYCSYGDLDGTIIIKGKGKDASVADVTVTVGTAAPGLCQFAGGIAGIGIHQQNEISQPEQPPTAADPRLQVSDLALKMSVAYNRDTYGLCDEPSSKTPIIGIRINDSKFSIEKSQVGGKVCGVFTRGPLTISDSEISITDQAGKSDIKLLNAIGGATCNLARSTFTIDQKSGSGIPHFVVHSENGLVSENSKFSLSTFSQSPDIHCLQLSNGNISLVGDEICAEEKGSTVDSAAVQITGAGDINLNKTAADGQHFYATAINFAKNVEISGALSSFQIGFAKNVEISGALSSFQIGPDSTTNNINIGTFAAGSGALSAIDLSAVTSQNLIVNLVGSENRIVALNGTTKAQTFTATTQNPATAAIKLCSGATLKLGSNNSSNLIIGGITGNGQSTVEVNGTSNRFWGTSRGVGTWDLSRPMVLENSQLETFSRKAADNLSLNKLPQGSLILADGEKIVFHINADEPEASLPNFGNTVGYLQLSSAGEEKQLVLPASNHGTFAIVNHGGTIPEKRPFYLIRIDGQRTTVGDVIESEMQPATRSSTSLINGFTACKIANGSSFVSTGNGYTSWENLELYWIYNGSQSGLVARSKSATPPGTTTRSETLYLNHDLESTITFGKAINGDGAQELLDGDFNTLDSSFSGEGFVLDIATPATGISIAQATSNGANKITLNLPAATAVSAKLGGIYAEPGNHGDIILKGQRSDSNDGTIRIVPNGSSGDIFAIGCNGVTAGSVAVDGVAIDVLVDSGTVTNRVDGFVADQSTIPTMLKNSALKIQNASNSQQSVRGISLDRASAQFDLIGSAIDVSSTASQGTVSGIFASSPTAGQTILVDGTSSITASIINSVSTGSAVGLYADRSASDIKLVGNIRTSSTSRSAGAMVYGIAAAGFSNSIFVGGNIDASATQNGNEIYGLCADDSRGKLTLSNGTVSARNGGIGSATALSMTGATGHLVLDNATILASGHGDRSHEITGLEMSSFAGTSVLSGGQIYAGNRGSGSTHGVHAPAINLGSAFTFSNREGRDDAVQIIAENRSANGSCTGIFINENEAEVSVFNADQSIELNFLPLGNGVNTLDTTIVSLGVAEAKAIDLGHNSLLQMGGMRNNVLALTTSAASQLSLDDGSLAAQSIAATAEQAKSQAIVVRGGGIVIGNKTYRSINNIVGGISGASASEKPIALLQGKETNLWGTSKNIATMELAGPVILKSAGTNLSLPLKKSDGTSVDVTFNSLPTGKIEIAANDILAIHIDSSAEDPDNRGFKSVPGYLSLESNAEPQLVLNGKIALMDDSVLGNSLANTNYWIIRSRGGENVRLGDVIQSAMALGTTKMTLNDLELLEVENAANFITTASPYTSWDGLKLYWFANSTASGLIVGSARPQGLTGIYVDDSSATSADVYGINAYRSLGGSELRPNVNITVFGRCSTSDHREGYNGIVAGYYAPNATGTMSFSSHIRAENNNPSANGETAVFGVQLDGTHNDSLRFSAAKNSATGEELASISAIHRGLGTAHGISLQDIASRRLSFDGPGAFRVFAQAHGNGATALNISTKTLTEIRLGTMDNAAPTDQLIFTAFAPAGQLATALSAHMENNINGINAISSLTPNLYLIGLSGNLGLKEESQQLSFDASSEGQKAGGNEAQRGAAIEVRDLTALSLGNRSDLTCNHYLIGGIRGIAGPNGKPELIFHGNSHIWGKCHSFNVLDLRGDVHLKTATSKSLERAIPWGITQAALPLTLNNLPTGKILLSGDEALLFHVEHQNGSDLLLGKLILEESNTGQRSELIFDSSKPGKIRVTSQSGDLLGQNLELCLVEVRDASNVIDTTAVITGLQTAPTGDNGASLLEITNEADIFDNRINGYAFRDDLHLRLSNRLGLKGLYLMSSDPVVLAASTRTQPFFVSTKNNRLQIKFGPKGESLPPSNAYASPDTAFTEAQKYFTRLIASDSSGIKIVDSATGRTVEIIATGGGPSIDAVRFSDGETLIGVDASRCLSQLIFEFEPELVESLLLAPQTPKLLRELVESVDLSSLHGLESLAHQTHGNDSHTADRALVTDGRRTAKMGQSQNRAYLKATDYASRFINTELIVSNITAIAMAQNALRSSLENLDLGNYASIASLAAHSYQREIDGFGYHNDLFGFTIQGQHIFDASCDSRSRLSLGSVGGYVNGKMNCFGKLEAQGKVAKQDMYFGGLVGAFQHTDGRQRRTNINFFAGGMFGRNQLWRRDEENKSFSAKFQNGNFFANLEGLQTLCQISPWEIDLWLGLNYHYAHQQGYQEKPSEKGSAILSSIHSSTLGLIGGLNFERTILQAIQPIGTTHINFRFGLLAQPVRNVSSVTAIAEIRDVGIGSFTPRLTRRDRYALITNAGIRNRLTKNWQIEFGWEGNFSKNYVYNNLSANLGFYF